MGDHLVSRICGIFACRSAALLIADPSSGVLSLLAAKQPPHPEELDRSLLLPLQDPTLVALRNQNRPIPMETLRDTQPREEESSVLLSRLEMLDGILVVPLMNHQRLVGLLLLGPRDSGQKYHGEELQLLGLLSFHVASVFQNAHLFESVTYESLTGLLRRKAILDHLDQELQRALRDRCPLTIGLADLDHFKNVNDDHGHLAGDSLLRGVAHAIQRNLRTTDAVGRYGGEEFLLVLPETDLRHAQAVAERVRTAVQDYSLDLGDGDFAAVTVSIGLATLDGEGCEGCEPITANDLLGTADRILYNAKEAGRNRVHPPLTHTG